MAAAFSKYKFRLGMLSTADRGGIAVSVPIISKDSSVKIVFNKGYINGNNGFESMFIPQKNNAIFINPKTTQIIKFSFSPKEIRRYEYGAKIEIEFLDLNERVVVTAVYSYEHNSAWRLKEVTDIPLAENMINEDAIQFQKVLIENYDGKFNWNIKIEEMNLSVRTYNCLKRANINALSDLRIKTAEDIRCIRNIGCKTFEEILAKMAQYGVHILEE